MSERIALSGRALWYAAVGVGATLVAVYLGPAFWLCGIGVVLLGAVSLVNSKRTGEWAYVPWRARDVSALSHGEQLVAVTALLLVSVPLVVVLFRVVRYWGVH